MTRWLAPSTDAQAYRQQASAPTETRSLPVEPVANELIEFLEFWKSGNLPSNAMLLAWMRRFSSTDALQPRPEYSPRTRQLLEDLRIAFDRTAALLNAKNEDECLQNLLYHLGLASRLALADLTQDRRIFLGGTNATQKWYLGTGREAESMRVAEDLRRNLDSLYGVLRVLFTSHAFRHVLNDVNALIRTVFTDATSGEEVDEKSKEEKPALSGKETAASAKQPPIVEQKPESFVDKPLLSESPIASGSPLRLVQASSHEEYRADLQSMRNANERAQNELEAAAAARIAGGSAAAVASVQKTRSDPAAISAFDKELERLPIIEKQTTAETPFAAQKASPAKQAADGRKAFEMRAPFGIKRDAIADTLRKTTQKIRENTQLRSAFTDFAYLFGKLLRAENMRRISPLALPEELKRDANIQQIAVDFYKIIGRFSSPEAVRRLTQLLGDLAGSVKRDVELRTHFSDWIGFLHTCTAEKAFIATADFDERLQRLLDAADRLYTQRYRRPIDALMRAWSDVTRALLDDTLLIDFVRAWDTVLVRDLIGSSSMSEMAATNWNLSMLFGLPVEIGNDVKNFILPAILQDFRFIPLPELVCEDADFLLVLRNVVLSAENIVPAHIEVAASQHMVMHPRERLFGVASASGRDFVETLNGSRIVLRSLKPALKDIYFRYERLRGAAKGTVEEGLVDVDVTSRKGLTLVLEIFDAPAAARRAFKSTFEARVVHAKFHGFTIRLHKTKHDLRYRFMYPLIKARLRRTLERTIEGRTREFIADVDARVTALRRKLSA